MNLPWSGSESSDDVWWQDCSAFEGRVVVVTEKMDGECTTVYHDGYVHARSMDTSHHPSRSWVKQLASRFAYELPDSYRVCGENLYACHSIFYTDLPSYFMVYGIYDGGRCLPWDEVEEFCELLHLETVPVLYRGLWDEQKMRGLWQGRGRHPTYEIKPGILNPKFPDDFTSTEAEGYVVRLVDGFPYSDFSLCCAKYVRENHVKTDQHWLERPPIPNLLKSS